jgi:transglycosylase-like protein with SLT domain
MRRFNATILLIALQLLQLPQAYGNTESKDPSPAPMSAAADPPLSDGSLPQEPGNEASTDIGAEPQGPVVDNTSAPLSRDEICQMIERAANEEALPPEFFARLIWQESRFDPSAVSPVGAQGIAQFMPRTANGRGLTNPFDALPALFESAEYLAELRRQFGNLGLAAAAYNAGPKRVQDWLSKRGGMTAETRNYVHLITGHPLETWAAAEPPAPEDIAIEDFRCHEVPKLAAQRYRRLLAEIVRRVREERAAKAEQAEKKARAAKLEALTAKSRKGAKVADRAARGKGERAGGTTKVASERNAPLNLTIMKDSRDGRRAGAKQMAKSERAAKVAQVSSRQRSDKGKAGARRVRVAQR